MDDKDLQIVRELQKNGRLTNLELAERVNLSPSPCLRRVKKLERRGVIRGYTAVVDQGLYGLPITVFIRIRLERHAEEHVGVFEREIAAVDEVLDCYLMTGDADYLLRVIMPSLESYEAFIRTRLQRIPGVASIDTGFAYGTVKQTHVFPKPE